MFLTHFDLTLIKKTHFTLQKMNTLEDRISLSVHSVLYILDKLGGKGDFHKIFKILYFADQKHLTRFGAFFTDDQYVAMKNGPVPSMTYDILKALRGQGLHSNDQDKFKKYFNLLDSYNVESSVKPDLDELSESAIQCLNESISENKKYNFDELTELSHDLAWEKTGRDCEINVEYIAEAGGANPSMIEYIKTNIENQQAKLV